MWNGKKGMVRFRVLFDDPRLLNNRQLSYGLARCWVLLEPSIVTFADLASHLREKFAICDPLLLFIDDFVLPPFVSTCILKDEDIIRVKLMNAKQENDLLPCDGQNVVQDPQIVRARGLPFNNNIMTDEKSEANSQGNGNNENSIHDDNLSLGIGVLEQNREHSPELLNSLRKRQKLNCSEKQIASVGVQDIHSKQNRTFCNVSSGSNGLVVARPVSEASLGEPSCSMPCNGRQQSGGINNALESEPHILCDVTKECALSSAATSKKDHSQFTTAIFNGRNFSVDANEKDSSDFCMENHALIDRKPKGDSSDNKAKNAEHKVDFATLFPLTRSPLKGDILTYRYVEPSSTAYPVLSAPQVGKVSTFDYKSSHIVLVPAPEFEVFSEENPKLPISPQMVLPYKKDGSLEINLSALIDVRLLKAHNSIELACLPDGTFNQIKKDKWELALAKSNWNQSGAHHTGRANGAIYTGNGGRASTSWIYGESPAANLFWETVLSKGAFGKGAKCSSSGKY